MKAFQRINECTTGVPNYFHEVTFVGTILSVLVFRPWIMLKENLRRSFMLLLLDIVSLCEYSWSIKDICLIMFRLTNKKNKTMQIRSVDFCKFVNNKIINWCHVLTTKPFQSWINIKWANKIMSEISKNAKNRFTRNCVHFGDDGIFQILFIFRRRHNFSWHWNFANLKL